MASEQITPIPAKVDDVNEYMKERVGVGVSFDVGHRTLIILKKKVEIYYTTGLADAEVVQRVLSKLMSINDDERNTNKVSEIIENRLVHMQVKRTESIDDCVDQFLSGLIVVFIDGCEFAFVVDTRSYPGRQPEEPDTEKVIRGPRDGYTENIIINTALTRRRIRDERLRLEMMQVGERSKTDICIAYIEDVADPNLVKLIKKELKEIEIDGLPMSDKSVEEYLVKQGNRPFPLVRYTERPDIGAVHLFEGHVLIIVDTSPSVIITPATYFSHLQHAEEYRESPAPGTFIRWVRLTGIFVSLFLLPFWYLITVHPELLPQSIDFIGPNKDDGHIPLFLQILLADLGIEFLRLAAIHTPTPLSTAMGLIAAILIGEIAINVGLFTPEVILYVAVSAVGSFVTPSFELSVSNKITRLFFLVATAIFGVPGFVISITLAILILVGTKSLNTPYMWPFIPFNMKALLEIAYRTPVPLTKYRPSITNSPDKTRAPNS
ncbi:spore germination protein [Terribacillus saccharophilus]|uniref:Spore germination protein n=1 Tax=Terribacillus saccharophilus TaxID=361277 RepID=A0A268ADB6_9BACI|nr:spore germination protein [Terribacillus saccharophilus]PAD22107.1 spore germination protein [Terribacillus saccharophilus]